MVPTGRGAVDTFDLLIVGELNVDLILSDDDPVPEFGQREKLVRDAALELGSAAAIMACQAGRLGLRTAFVGKMGDDAFGRLLAHTLQARGVNTRAIIVDPTLRTGITVHLSQPRDRATLTYLGSIAAFRAEEVPIDLVRQSRHLHASSIFFQPGLVEGLPALFRAAHELGLSTSVDPGWDPAGRWREPLEQLLPLLDLFFPNEQELCHITCCGEADQALRQIGRMVPTVVVKRGARGAAALQHGVLYEEPPIPVDPVDTTGAGDSFNAGFLQAYLRGRDIRTCLRWGCVCGGLVTTHVGGIAGQPTAEQVETFIASSVDQKETT